VVTSSTACASGKSTSVSMFVSGTRLYINGSLVFYNGSTYYIGSEMRRLVTDGNSIITNLSTNVISTTIYLCLP
jgi:hypothetical protein